MEGGGAGVLEELMAPLKQTVAEIFPRICSKYLRKVAEENDFVLGSVISTITDSIESGQPYPRETRKRKRSDSNENGRFDENRFARLYSNQEHKKHCSGPLYRNLAKTLLMQDFPLLYSKDIENMFRKNENSLFLTYMHLSSKFLDNDVNTDGHGSEPYLQLRKRPGRLDQSFNRDQIAKTMDNRPRERMVFEEFQAARSIHDKRKSEKDAKDRQKQAEIENEKRAKLEGTMHECGCCMDDFPRNRMIYCQASQIHWFCRGCVRRQAEIILGQGKYDIQCLSTEGCSKGFARDQIKLFLDDKSIVALERLEIEDSLRKSGIENLESCPFCPFAAECDPIEEDKEFRCQNEECMRTSCRLCREETHLPMSCEEAKLRKKGLSARQMIEEAMSAALIRRCNKCKTPFIKKEGCNKMTCSKCGHRQCYICGKPADYSHFDGARPGGNPGGCPIYDEQIGGINQRHLIEVENAEKAARAKVLADDPELNNNDLLIKVSEKLNMDKEKQSEKHHNFENEEFIGHQQPPWVELCFERKIAGTAGRLQPVGTFHRRRQHIHQHEVAPNQNDAAVQYNQNYLRNPAYDLGEQKVENTQNDDERQGAPAIRTLTQPPIQVFNPVLAPIMPPARRGPLEPEATAQFGEFAPFHWGAHQQPVLIDHDVQDNNSIATKNELGIPARHAAYNRALQQPNPRNPAPVIVNRDPLVFPLPHFPLPIAQNLQNAFTAFGRGLDIMPLPQNPQQMLQGTQQAIQPLNLYAQNPIAQIMDPVPPVQHMQNPALQHYVGSHQKGTQEGQGRTA